MAKDANKKELNNKKHFFKDFKAELKKVIWPTPKQIVNNTIAVITIVIITAAIVFVLDLVFDILNDKGINRLKENIKETAIVEEDAGIQESEENEETTAEENTQTTETSEENAVSN